MSSTVEKEKAQQHTKETCAPHSSKQNLCLEMSAIHKHNQKHKTISLKNYLLIVEIFQRTLLFTVACIYPPRVNTDASPRKVRVTIRSTIKVLLLRKIPTNHHTKQLRIHLWCLCRRWVVYTTQVLRPQTQHVCVLNGGPSVLWSCGALYDRPGMLGRIWCC